MAEKRIQLRRDTSSNWSSANPTLYLGEPGYDTTLKRLKLGDGSTAWNSLGWLKQDGVLFSNTATPSAITSTSETDFTTGTTGYTIAASSVAVGDVFTVSLAGFYSGTTLPNLTAKVYVGSTVVATTGSFAGLAAGTDLPWRAEIVGVVRATGASGTLQAEAEFMFSTAATTALPILIKSTGYTIDFTATKLIKVSMQWAGGGTGQTITLDKMTVRRESS